MYFENGRLNWEVPAAAGMDPNQFTWTQHFNTSETQSAPTVSLEGWELGFTVSKNQRTNNQFSGNLRGFVAIADATPGKNGHEGVYFKDITQEGNYLIKFNFDGDITNYTDNDNDLKPWEFLRADLGFLPTPDSSIGFGGVIVNTSSMPTWTAASKADRIQFMQMNGQNANQEYAVSDIQLTDSKKVFLGGSSGSWNFDGFNTSTDNYIHWDTDNFNLVFLNCPVVDPTAGGLKFINVNQQVDATIKQYEKYKISFTHTISTNTAKLSLYYYNSEGWGFKISDIDSNTASSHSEIVTIGDPAIIADAEAADPPQWPSCKWSNINLADSSYQADFKNSFVISVGGDSTERIDGTIDNIEMVRVYTDSNFEDTTVTFSENVNGWTSFKTFVPENGVSVSKKYFTFDNGGLYQHYVPTVNVEGESRTYRMQGATKVYYTPEEADNYNKFYSVFTPSSITTTFNQEPSIIKTFNTLNYEGSQTYVKKPLSMFHDSIIDPITELPLKLVNINNVQAWTHGSDINGWECQEIKTDLDVGTINEFIKKEGKWFNYIRGKVNTGTPDTSLFSVQGVGIIDSIS